MRLVVLLVSIMFRIVVTVIMTAFHYRLQIEFCVASDNDEDHEEKLSDPKLISVTFVNETS